MILVKSARYNLEASQTHRNCNTDLQTTLHTQWISKFVTHLCTKFLMPSSNASSSLLYGKLRKMRFKVKVSLYILQKFYLYKTCILPNTCLHTRFQDSKKYTALRRSQNIGTSVYHTHRPQEITASALLSNGITSVPVLLKNLLIG
jgi:hypothetical protein